MSTSETTESGISTSEIIDRKNQNAWDIIRSDPNRGIEIAISTLELSRENDYRKGEALALAILGAGNIWLSNYEDALTYSQEARSLLSEINDSYWESQVLYNISITFYYLSDYDNQLKYSIESHEMSRKAGDLHGIANALNSIGTVYYTIDENEKAIENLEKGLDAAESADDIMVKCKILDGLGQANYNLGNYKEAKAYKLQCLEEVEKIGVLQIKSYALDGLGAIHAKLKEYEKALDYYGRCRSIRGEMGFRAGEAETIMHIGQVHLESGDPEKGIARLEEAIDLADKVGAKDVLYQSNKSLADHYESKGDLQQFVDCFKAYHAYREEFFSERTRQQIKGAELQAKMERMQEEKVLLQQKNKELKSYFKDVQTLSQIGSEITATQDFESIFSIVYDRVNSLMDASGIFIGLLNEEKQVIEVRLAMDEGKRDEYFEYSMANDAVLPVWVIKNRKEVYINDYEREVHSYLDNPEKFIREQPKSLVILPLQVKDRVLGILFVQSLQKNAYSLHHLNILKSIANYSAIAFENAALYRQQEDKIRKATEEITERKEEIERSYETTRTLGEIGQQITSTLDIEAIFSKLHDSVNELMDAACFAIRIVDKEEGVIRYKYEYERGQRHPEETVSLSDIDNYSVWCVNNKKEIFIGDNTSEYKKYVDEIKVVTGDMPHSLMFCPMMVGDRAIGVITAQSFEKYAYREHHLDILKTLASYTAVALDNANLYERLEVKVKERTVKLEKRNENARILGEVGQKISASLSVEKIIEDTYETVNSLMDASIFGIGIHEPEKKELIFTGAIEKGEKLPSFTYDVDEDRIATNCFRESLEIRIDDWEEEYGKFVKGKDQAKAGELPESMLYMPLSSKEKNVGVITIQCFEKNAYSDYHLDILRTLSVYVANALDNARLYSNMEAIVEKRTSEVVKQKEEIEKSYENTRLLGEIGQQLTSTLDFESIFLKLHESVNKLMDAACFGVRLYNPEKEVITYRFEMESGERNEVVDVPMYNDDNYSVWCVKNRKEIFINDNQKEHGKYVSKIHVVSGDMPHSLIFCPMLVGDKCLGVITVQSFDRNAYTPYHMDMLRSLASNTAIALDNAALYENLEEKVRERTAEVVSQKEQIEKNHRDSEILTNIGKKITTILSAEKIVDEVYESINKLMDAPCLGIGVYKKQTNSIAFPGYIEKGEKMRPDDYFMNEENRLAVICYKNKKEIVTNDFQKDAHKWISDYVPPKVGEQTESIIYLPLMIQEKCVGVITLQSFEKNAFRDYHLNLARSISIYVAIAIDNANLYENLEDQVKERTAEVVKQKEEIQKTYEDTRLMGEIGRQITSSLSIEKIISQTYENVNNLMDGTMFGIGIFDEATNSILMPGFYENNVRMEDFSYSLDDDNRLAVYSFKNNTEVVINDYSKEYNKYIKQAQKPVSGKDSTSIVYIPLSSHDKVIGVITVQSWEPNAYSDYHVSILRNLGVYAAIALENAMLYENMEEEVKERTQEVVSQAMIIEEKNKSITDSIKYAQRIQQATLPPRNLARQLFKDSFVLFKPKDIVSGDFYWMEQRDDEFIFAVVDCTGHGVPGAFMSLIGHNALKQIVAEQGITQPAAILDRMNEIVTNTLNKTTDDDTKMRDGMDAAVCTLNIKTNVLQFSGAYNPLWLVRNGEVQEIKGDKQPIGHFDESDGIIRKDFTNYELQMENNDCLYIFSDGYADQFGGSALGGKKFKYTRFKKLLVEIHESSMANQLSQLDETIEQWRGDLEQIDDVCVMGVRV